MNRPAKLTFTPDVSQRARVRAVVQQCETLPTPPFVVHHLVAFTADLNTPFKEVEEAIKSDVSCVARLLYMANSAFYHSHRSALSIHQIVLMFGLNTVQETAKDLPILDGFYLENSKETALFNRLRLHSFAVATLSARIAAHSAPTLSADQAFTAGLLHNIGQFVFLHFFSDDYFPLLARCDSATESDLMRGEMHLFEVSHTTVGQWLGEKWHFPHPVLQVIAEHHHGRLRTPLITTVQLAITLVNRQEIGLWRQDQRSDTIDTLCRRLDIPLQSVPCYETYLESVLPHLQKAIYAKSPT